ncbi:MAG: RNA pseudouridine synthase, partial [Rikenellaceae bacterium]
MFYPLKDELIESCGLPARFTNPFDYRPHPLVVEATKILRLHLDKHAEWSHEISRGKMFGVLIVRSTYGEVGFLAAFSGNLDNKTVLEGFVPPIFNLKASDSFFWHEEGEITRINTRLKELQANTSYLKLTAEKEQLRGTTTTQIAEYRAKIKLDKEGRREEREGGCSPERQAQLNRESQYQKAELKRLEARHAANLEDIDNLLKEYVDEINDLKYMRKKLSIELQRKIFDHYNILNHKAQSITLTQLFSQTLNTLPPAGAGECAAPKLLNYAFQNNMEIIAMGEFWQGASPKGEVRHHNSFYPACNSKCRPILGYMLGGMALAPLTVA